MKISIAQFKSNLGEIDKNFEIAADFIRNAQNCDVLVLPELWTTGYFPTPLENYADKNGERLAEFISGWAKKMNLNIVGGSTVAEVGGKFYNRCLVANRAGEIVATYDKTHLFTFASEQTVFTPGDKIVTVELDGVKCGLAICYDLRFPEFIRKLTLEGIKMLLMPSAWTLMRLVPRQILTKARAIENQIFVVFANSAGHSEVVNPLGVIISEAGAGSQMLTATFDFESSKKFIEAMNLLADRNLAVDSI